MTSDSVEADCEASRRGQPRLEVDDDFQIIHGVSVYLCILNLGLRMTSIGAVGRSSAVGYWCLSTCPPSATANVVR